MVDQNLAEEVINSEGWKKKGVRAKGFKCSERTRIPSAVVIVM